MNISANRPLPRVMVTAVVLAVALFACGSDTTVTAAGDSGETGESPGGVDCAERLDQLVEQLRVDVAYDYEPTDSPAELAELSDAVVTGTLGEFGVDGENVTAVIDDVEVVAGDAAVGPDGDLTISWYVSPEPREVADGTGITVLAFLYDGGGDTPAPEIEGLWFACGTDSPARSMIVEPVEAGWPAGPDATVDNLVLAVTDPDAAGASAPETFGIGSPV